jgi:SAM-dependent methyltransferase
MEMLGVSEGWKCLNVGAGYGSITAWLANKVGHKGKIVATDIRAGLHRDAGNNVEIRQHNILTDELENNYYDLVHCRALLQHLTEYEKALTNMSKAVKPGGWILIEELDNFTSPPSDSNNPDADFFYKWYQQAGEIMKRFGSINLEFGRNVRCLVDQLDFQDVGSEGITVISRGGEPMAKFASMSFKANSERLQDELTEEEKQQILGGLDKVINLFEDPNFYYVGIPLFCAWGRKPKY